jgi:L-rhamnose isomerase
VDSRAEYEAALRNLPDAHALALRLHAAGADADAMCQRLGIEPEGLETLLEVARKKLQYMLDRE